MDTSISGDRYIAYLAYIHHSGALGRFFEEFRRKKKKTDPHACTHKNDPKRFSDDFATNWRWDLAKSLCLCEIMQKRIPTDTRKSHFPTRGRRETGFVSKEKKFVSNPLRYIASSSQKNQVFTFCIHVFAFKLFFSCSAPYSAKKRLKGPQWYNWSNSIEVPPPSPLVHRLLRERWNMIIDSARIEFPKK